MKKKLMRNPLYADIEKYIRNAERGRLPLTHDGKDVTRQITQEQVQKFLDCSQCQTNPVVFFPWKKGTVGLCAKCWSGLADTVIGWHHAEKEVKN